MSKREKSKRQKEGSLDVSKGVLEITRSGLGFVVTGSGGDVLVRPGDFNTALNGDTVRVKVTKENERNGKREGRITEVVSRKQNDFVGHIQMGSNYAFFIPDTDKPMPDFYIAAENLNGAQDKERVVARLTKWEKGNRKPEGRVLQVVRAEDESDIAMKEILTENGFPLQFPDDVMEEAERLPELIAQADIEGRRDFRKILTFTIDPVDARDFDDAISIKRLRGNQYEIGVHIADVSHFVQPGSELDNEGYSRATSVYLPDRVNPMLPERISNELCSLRPNEDKLTFSAVFTMNAKGDVKQSWLGKTVIHSNHRFTYEDVQDIIESGAGLYEKEILLLNNIAQVLRKNRFSKGAINFSSTEVRFKLDEKGKPVGIVVKESREAHQLIEELMLLANRTVAESVSAIKVKDKAVPFPYRVHDEPDEEKLTPFIAFAGKYGHRFDTSSPERIAHSFNTMLEEVQGKPEQHVLEQLGIRTMAKAAYTTDNVGHYGLGFDNYCHFTSPIRRYPDILVHRILQSCLEGTPFVDKKMEEKSRHCSVMERSAMDAERAANKYKQVEFLKEYIGDEFPAVVSGVAGFGFWAETIEHKCEGLISINSLIEYDDFRLIESEYCLAGRRTGRTFRIGDKVTIKVISANLGRRQLDFEWVKNAPEAREQDETSKDNQQKSKGKAKTSGRKKKKPQ